MIWSLDIAAKTRQISDEESEEWRFSEYLRE